MFEVKVQCEDLVPFHMTLCEEELVNVEELFEEILQGDYFRIILEEAIVHLYGKRYQ